MRIQKKTTWFVYGPIRIVTGKFGVFCNTWIQSGIIFACARSVQGLVTPSGGIESVTILFNNFEIERIAKNLQFFNESGWSMLFCNFPQFNAINVSLISWKPNNLAKYHCCQIPWANFSVVKLFGKKWLDVISSKAFRDSCFGKPFNQPNKFAEFHYCQINCANFSVAKLFGENKISCCIKRCFQRFLF